MLTIIDYGVGNLASLANAFKKLKIPFQISFNSEEIQDCDALILPGVGAAGFAMRRLEEKQLDKAIIDQVSKGKPILGICLGMQLLFEYSEEDNTECLGIIKGNVKRYENKKVKVPQIGWNNISINPSNPKAKLLFKEIEASLYFYFVNSYYCNPEDTSNILAKSEYGKKYCCAIAYKNIYGFQFHPEKSGIAGLTLLKNFYDTISNNTCN